MTSRVVPREPDEAMIVAGSDAWLEKGENQYVVFAAFIRSVWQAMFDAAPACDPVPDAELAALAQRLDDYAAGRVSLTGIAKACRESFRAIAALRQQNAELRAALQILHDETADYVRLNNLGDPYSNQSMRMARDAIDKQAEGK